jgi:major membrane immunogen (membrane-anchored lipoprotein)
VNQLRFPAAAVLGAALLLSACGDSAGNGKERGTLQAKWTGADKGGLVASASAAWCAATKTLRVVGIKQDRGVALSVPFADSIAAGDHPLGPEGGAQNAQLALRLVSDSLVKGFRADSGVVVIGRYNKGEVSGHFQASLSDARGPDSLGVRGSFQGLPVRTAPAPCATLPDTDASAGALHY